MSSQSCLRNGTAKLLSTHTTSLPLRLATPFTGSVGPFHVGTAVYFCTWAFACETPDDADPLELEALVEAPLALVVLDELELLPQPAAARPITTPAVAAKPGLPNTRHRPSLSLDR